MDISYDTFIYALIFILLALVLYYIYYDNNCIDNIYDDAGWRDKLSAAVDWGKSTGKRVIDKSINKGKNIARHAVDDVKDAASSISINSLTSGAACLIGDKEERRECLKQVAKNAYDKGKEAVKDSAHKARNEAIDEIHKEASSIHNRMKETSNTFKKGIQESAIGNSLDNGSRRAIGFSRVDNKISEFISKVDPNKLLEYKMQQMDWSDLPEEVVNAEKEKIQNEVKMIGSSLNSLELLTGKDITGDGEIANNEYGNFENEPNNNNNNNGNN